MRSREIDKVLVDSSPIVNRLDESIDKSVDDLVQFVRTLDDRTRHLFVLGRPPWSNRRLHGLQAANLGPSSIGAIGVAFCDPGL
jgi:hypothetical protein